MTNATPEPTEPELLAYLKRRNNNIAIAITVAVAVGILGFGAWTIRDGNRAQERNRDHLACEFAGFSDC